MPAILDNLSALRRTVADWRAAGQRIALVPTMGALHDGHLSLVRAAHERADRVLVSIFVNPTQFAPHEDFDRYPRDLAGDSARLAPVGVDAIYAPTVAAMYPPGHETRVTPGRIAEPMEGTFRPGFFTGVATVVAKLLIQTGPDVALFGEKDYQQLQVIRQLAHDLDLPVEIVGCPIVRETDGLAMSSRNAYLSPADREAACTLCRVLNQTAGQLATGQPFAALHHPALAEIVAAGFDQPDYLDLRDAATLEPLERAGDRPGRLLVAARLNGTRLIDNLAVPAIA